MLGTSCSNEFHPCNKSFGYQAAFNEPDSLHERKKEQKKIIHCRMATVLLSLSDAHNTLLIKQYFPAMPQVKKRGKRGMSSALLFPTARASQVGWLSSSPRSRSFTFQGLSPAGLLCPATHSEAGTACRHGVALGQAILMVKGYMRGHSKSFTNISRQSSLFLLLLTAGHKRQSSFS